MFFKILKRSVELLAERFDTGHIFKDLGTYSLADDAKRILGLLRFVIYISNL